MRTPVYTGSGVAIVTPMNTDFSINYPKLGELIDWQIENGTDAIIICGTTGEASTMTDEEHIECVRHAVERTAKRVPVIAGVGSNDTAYALWLCKEAKRAGADALLNVTPYYNKTSQRGLIAHFTACADATDLPTILYNVPSRTGMTINPETYFELSKHPNIVGTKEASSNIAAIAKTASLCGPDFAIYSGNDNEIIPLMSLGGKGVISVLANICPRETHDMTKLYLDGKCTEATKMQLDYLNLVDAIFCDVNPIPVKEALNMMGKAAGPCRLPLYELSDAHKDLLRRELAAKGLV